MLFGTECDSHTHTHTNDLSESKDKPCSQNNPPGFHNETEDLFIQTKKCPKKKKKTLRFFKSDKSQRDKPMDG